MPAFQLSFKSNNQQYQQQQQQFNKKQKLLLIPKIDDSNDSKTVNTSNQFELTTFIDSGHKHSCETKDSDIFV